MKHDHLRMLLGGRAAASLWWAAVALGAAGFGAGEALEERDGLLVVEAESLVRQTKDEVRRWYVISGDRTSPAEPDPDPSHAATASGGAYLEILPDTRVTHDDKLEHGVSFSNLPGKVAVLDYPVRIYSPGRYYVWVRAYSTGTEDNGIHVGIDGEWPESGQRLQWCEGKRDWRWESKQRTAEAHCGVPHMIYLDIMEPGERVISFSMREDGFEFDKWVMTLERDFERPQGAGPEESARR